MNQTENNAEHTPDLPGPDTGAAADSRPDWLRAAWEGISPRLPLCLRLLLGRLRPGSRDLIDSGTYLAVGMLAVSLATAILVSLPQAPYNVRELFDGKTLLLSLPLFSAFLIWSASAPNLAARVTIICPFMHLLQPITLVAMAGPAWVMLRLAVTEESLVDILGEQPDEWASFVAFLGLVTPILLSLYIWNLLLEGSAWLNRRFGIGHMLAAVTFGLPMLWASKYIIIDQATTTRIIELSAQGPFWLIGGALAAAVSILTLNGVLLAWSRLWGNTYRLGLAIASPALLAASWWMLNHGLHEQAVAFLLGHDPENPEGTWGLFMRWTLVYLGAVVLIAAAHLIPFRLRGTSQHQRQALNRGKLHHDHRDPIADSDQMPT